jgi:hypothetical protein
MMASIFFIAFRLLASSGRRGRRRRLSRAPC